ncbi:hypothetical protein [Laribacter hongkongensis]|uniref:hypothetical protein n=1 Tax=Laribacter hongkongensis TaxID=168471 RepID=UPI00117DE7FB|nr:hypothetical protein [Laribacter hongkongensis]
MKINDWNKCNDLLKSKSKQQKNYVVIHINTRELSSKNEYHEQNVKIIAISGDASSAKQEHQKNINRHAINLRRKAKLQQIIKLNRKTKNDPQISGPPRLNI